MGTPPQSLRMLPESGADENSHRRHKVLRTPCPAGWGQASLRATLGQCPPLPRPNPGAGWTGSPGSKDGRVLPASLGEGGTIQSQPETQAQSPVQQRKGPRGQMQFCLTGGNVWVAPRG